MDTSLLERRRRRYGHHLYATTSPTTGTDPWGLVSTTVGPAGDVLDVDVATDHAWLRTPEGLAQAVLDALLATEAQRAFESALAAGRLDATSAPLGPPLGPRRDGPRHATIGPFGATRGRSRAADDLDREAPRRRASRNGCLWVGVSHAGVVDHVEADAGWLATATTQQLVTALREAMVR